MELDPDETALDAGGEMVKWYLRLAKLILTSARGWSVVNMVLTITLRRR
jgi:hypothetical protein